MSCECACCSGVHVVTPTPEQNRPGLSKIRHRPGRYATYKESMQARLSSTQYPELAALKTRASDDASLALCDAWAIGAEVLSFYQDRIANEGYLRTSTERRSLIELGRLTGYALRPGVSASVYLAYDLDASAGRVSIPIGTRAQSVPGAGEKMQTFETAEVLEARAPWSQIKVRLSEPVWRSRADDRADYGVLKKGLTLKGTATQLKPNDALLIDYGDLKTPVPYRVTQLTLDNDKQTTHVTLAAWNAVADKSSGGGAPIAQLLPIADLVRLIEVPLQLQPRDALRVPRTFDTTLARGAEIYSHLLTRQSPALREMLIPALRSFDAAGTARGEIKVYAMRTKSALFGAAAPGKVLTTVGADPGYDDLSPSLAWRDLPEIAARDGQTSVDLKHIPLDGTFEAIKPSDDATTAFVFVDFSAAGVDAPATGVFTVADNKTVSMSIGASISARVSTLTTNEVWRRLSRTELADDALLRGTQVYAQSEVLDLARDPIDDDVAGDESSNEIELDTFYDGLVPGMWVIAAGDRADIDDPAIKVPAAERAMIAAVRHDVVRLPSAATPDNSSVPLPGDTLHTFIKLAAPLAYTYRRPTFTLYGNVVRATHGETRSEPLGGGDATRTFQSFALKSPPLTYVSAATPSGVASTLNVRVNMLLWKEDPDLATAASDARVYLTTRDDSEVTTIRFGDGVHGARLPTGPDNITSAYRSGIGAAGNVRAGQVTLAADKPLGVKGVLNPIRASGGAEADSLEQARVNAPLTVTALDRLVSVQDYADFARCFAGIGKSAATILRDGSQSIVHVTIAGIDDEPIDQSSDLFVNLVAALRAYGDPHQRVRVQVREALSLLLHARVTIGADYRWEDVQPRIRQALLDRFGFAARELGQPVFRSDVLATIEGVRGAEHVSDLELRVLDSASLIAGLDPAETVAPPSGKGEGESVGAIFVQAGGQRVAPGWIDVAPAAVTGVGTYTPAQIAYLPPDVVDNLILELAP